MEIFIIFLIVIVYCLVLDVNLSYILTGGVALIGIFAVLLAIGFLICNICLLFSKRKEAKFLRMDFVKGSKYQVAYYLVEGKEYPCLFPKEGIMEEKLYNKEAMYHVLLNEKLGRVFDRFAVATCVLGLLFGSIIGAGVVVVLVGGLL